MTRYRASKLDCQGCSLKPQCCPNAPARKIPRSIHEGARDMARDIAKTEAYRTSRCQRKKVEMLFAHLKRILKLDRLRLRGPNGARDEFHLAATAQNLRKLAKLIPARAPTSRSSRFDTSSPMRLLKPVRLPPGRARFATRPIRTGLPTLMKTIGIPQKATLSRPICQSSSRPNSSWSQSKHPQGARPHCAAIDA